MTAQQKLKHYIINYAGITPKESISAENIDRVYDLLCDSDETSDQMQDARNDVRTIGEETDVPVGYSRYFEADSVALKMLDGTWVGWTYYHGGGKHSYPDEIDWIPDAYNLDVEEKEVTVTQRTFKKK